MSPEGYAYVAGGAGTEETMRENRAAFERWRIVPRMLRDVSTRDTAVEVLGTPLPEPVRSLPDRRPRDGAPRRGRRGCACRGRRGDPVRLLQPGVAADGGDRTRDGRRAALVPALLEHVERARREPRLARGELRLRAIVLTLDTTMLGWRIRDLDLAYLPFLRGKGIAQYTSDPVFVEALQETLRQEAPPARAHHARRDRDAPRARRARTPGRGSRTCARAWRAPRCAASSRRTRGRRSRGTTSRFLRERTRLPILLKGILHPADALAAVEHGMDGIVVSNHGGRQVDGAIATMDALPGVVEAVAGRVPVVLDSGSAPAPTSSARSRSAPRQSASGGRTCGGSPRAERKACAR